jgi:hypothetical protein
LLAQHLTRSAGVATVVAWGVVIVAVLVLRVLVPAAWVVPALSAGVSIGMAAGAVTGWLLVRRSLAAGASLGLARPLAVSLPAALVAGSAVASLPAAVLGAFGCAAGCAVVFLGLLGLLDRRLVRDLWALRGGGSRPAERVAR